MRYPLYILTQWAKREGIKHLPKDQKEEYYKAGQEFVGYGYSNATSAWKALVGTKSSLNPVITREAKASFVRGFKSKQRQKNPAKGKWMKVKAIKFLGGGKIQVKV